MGILSGLFSKIQKKETTQPEPVIVGEPIEQPLKELTQEEKNYRLLNAVINENQDEALKMLASGANPNFESRGNGTVILRLADSIAHPKEGFDPKVVFDAAIKAGLDLNKQNSEGLTPLMQIAHGGLGVKTVEQFMQWGHGRINHDLPLKEGYTAGEFVKDHLYRMVYGPTRWGYMKKLGANKRTDIDVAERLDAIDSMVKSWDMLHAVIRGDQAEALKMLNEGANPNYVSPVNGTLIEQLAKTYDNQNNSIDQKAIFEAALDKELEVNLYDRFRGHTPMTALLEKGVSDKALNGILQLVGDHLDKSAMDQRGKTVESYLKDRQIISISLAKKHSSNIR